MTFLRLILKGSAVLGALAGLFCFVRADAQAVEHLTLERAAPIYMNCQNLTKGGSSSQGPGWIELQSFQWGVGRPVSEIVITKPIDTATPAFKRAALYRTHDKCTLNFDKAETTKARSYMKTDTTNAEPYITIKLEDVLVSSDSSSSATESITLNFTKIETENKAQTGGTATGTGGTATSGKSVSAPGGILQSPGPTKPR